VQALEALKEHRQEQDRDRELFGADYDDNNLIFCRPEGGYYKPDKVSVRVTELARKAGLPGVGLHSLRHSHASELLTKGAPIPTVAKRLGHANANVTLSIYSHALEADELAAAKIWNDAMADVIEVNRRPQTKNPSKQKLA
jgi:integrase